MRLILVLVALATGFSASVSAIASPGQRRCTGSDSCTACTVCTGCGHCARGGGTCGVCRPPETKEPPNKSAKPAKKKPAKKAPVKKPAGEKGN